MQMGGCLIAIVMFCVSIALMWFFYAFGYGIFLLGLLLLAKLWRLMHWWLPVIVAGLVVAVFYWGYKAQTAE